MTEACFFECMCRLKSGDMQGLKPVYEEYGRLIYSAALGVCCNPHTAEDVVSEFFLRLRRAADVYKEGMGHKKWLVVSARNLTVDYLRKNRRAVPLSSGDGDEETIPDIPDDSADTEEKAASDISVTQMLSALNEAERETVNLKVYCGFTFSEIADIMAVPAGTAAWRYRSAVKKLRRLYKEVSE